MAGLITALDMSSRRELVNTLDQLNPLLTRVKIGKELFTTLGPDAIGIAQQRGYDVFLDLKYHDIPTTVAKAVRVAAQRFNVWMLDIHGCGGRKMMREALYATHGTNTIVVAVTELTSKPHRPHVNELALDAYESGLGGVVCAATDVKGIHSYIGTEFERDFVTVCPGIRLQGDDHHDQEAVTTPHQAAHDHGADYLVIGRSITQSPDPAATLDEIAHAIL